ncbi:MAG: histone deacetylase, partial [Acidobacteria bacterium]|nr:histone deacetylase [Acidobacteriota bacterium]
MRAFYTDHFVLELPPGHRFPMAKYRRLRERLLEEGVLCPENLSVPLSASDEDLLRVHDGEYLERVKTGNLRREEVRRLGFPWSPALVERSR